jgi:hypothetical protein
MNVREVVHLSGSWDDERDALGELNKTVMPILISSLDFDIQDASEQVKQIIASGVSIKGHEIREKKRDRGSECLLPL